MVSKRELCLDIEDDDANLGITDAVEAPEAAPEDAPKDVPESF